MGISAALFTHWVANFTVGSFFLAAVASFSVSGTYAFFASVSLLGALFTRIALIETKGKTLEEIEAELGHKSIEDK